MSKTYKQNLLSRIKLLTEESKRQGTLECAIRNSKEKQKRLAREGSTRAELAEERVQIGYEQQLAHTNKVIEGYKESINLWLDKALNLD